MGVELETTSSFSLLAFVGGPSCVGVELGTVSPFSLLDLALLRGSSPVSDMFNTPYFWYEGTDK